VIDQNNTKREVNETNNLGSRVLTAFAWPDLSVEVSDVTFLTAPVEGTPTQVNVTIRNKGKAGASGATVQLLEDFKQMGSTVTIDVTSGGSILATLTWIPSSAGSHNLTIFVNSKNDTKENKDYNYANNLVTIRKDVITRPDLEVRITDYPSDYNQTRDKSFQLNVIVYNIGETEASGVVVDVYLNNVDPLSLLGSSQGILVPPKSQTVVPVQCKPISDLGNFNLIIVVDPNNEIPEIREDNNQVTTPIAVIAPLGYIFIGSPIEDSKFKPGESVLVSGYVLTTEANKPIANVSITFSLVSLATGNKVWNDTTTSESNGYFKKTMILLEGWKEGKYNLTATAAMASIRDGSVEFTVFIEVPWWQQLVPILGIPMWMFLLILAIVVAVIVAVTIYMKVYGLGKLVECGECGAFIPESSLTCPKCGVEFEREMAKCSSCQAWIPVAVKRCPECGVEFATGVVEMADYQQKMRMQYDEVVKKFREDAQRQLGKALTDKEFQEWWKKQPTFLTFEDWLREEEEMRKMGSRPCPACGTLNSVTATVCHKCGTLLAEEKKPKVPPKMPPKEAVPPKEVEKVEVPPKEVPGKVPEAAPPEEVPKPLEAVPKKIVKKPIVERPIVQKKVIKKPIEKEEGEGETKESEEST